MIEVALYLWARTQLRELGWRSDYDWAQSVRAPDNAEDFCREYTWVVLNSGMKHTVARGLMERVWPRLIAGRPLHEVYRHVGKRGAIELVWNNRGHYFSRFQRQTHVDDVLHFCHGLPWIGPITKYHLAKNLGADVAKPDRWLVRLAESSGESVDALCARIAKETSDRVATVDVVLWRACAVGLLAIRNGRTVPLWPPGSER